MKNIDKEKASKYLQRSFLSAQKVSEGLQSEDVPLAGTRPMGLQSESQYGSSLQVDTESLEAQSMVFQEDFFKDKNSKRSKVLAHDQHVSLG